MKLDFVFRISKAMYIFKDSQDQNFILFLPEEISSTTLQRSDEFWRWEGILYLLYIFWYKEVNLIALIKAKCNPQQSVNNLSLTRKTFGHVKWDFFWLIDKPHSNTMSDAEFFSL